MLVLLILKRKNSLLLISEAFFFLCSFLLGFSFEFVNFIMQEMVVPIYIPANHIQHIFFHPHKCGFQIRFRIAIPVFPHDLEAVFIFHQAPSAFFQFFVQLLDSWLFLALLIYKCDPLPCRDQHRVLPEFQDLDRRTEGVYRIQQADKVVTECSVPDECIAFCIRLYFYAICFANFPFFMFRLYY